ncbi:MAG: malto-oligosyltrehalose synthase, partial [bacterium]|nr:malto-oligosyltrehalose synthase [bacterium]
GEYLPLTADGPDAAHVIAFARQLGDERIIVVVPRLTLQLLDRGQGALRVAARVRLPEGCRQSLMNVVTGRRHDAVDGALDLSEVWGDFPVGLLSCGG